MITVLFGNGPAQDFPDADPSATIITDGVIELFNKKPGLQGCKKLATIIKGDRDSIVLKIREVSQQITDVDVCNLVLEKMERLPSWKLIEIKKRLRSFNSHTRKWNG